MRKTEPSPRPKSFVKSHKSPKSVSFAEDSWRHSKDEDRKQRLGDSGYGETRASEIKMFDNPYKRSREVEKMASDTFESKTMYNERPPLPSRSAYQPLGGIKPYEPEQFDYQHTSYTPKYHHQYRCIALHNPK